MFEVKEKGTLSIKLDYIPKWFLTYVIDRIEYYRDQMKNS